MTRPRAASSRNRSWRRAGGAIAVVAVVAFLVTALNSLDARTRTAQLGPVGEIPNRVVTGLDHDVPCIERDDGTEVCATPLPALSAADAATAKRLVVDQLSVPLDHTGSYRVYVGDAILARGVLQELTLAVADPSDQFLAESFRLEIEEAATKKVLSRNPLVNPIQAEPVAVHVFLVFDLERYDKGSAVVVSKIVVG
jgi:hypothetical protein